MNPRAIKSLLANPLVVLLLLAAPEAVQGQSGSGDGFGYSINASNANTITITNYTGPGGTVNIPTTINNLTVTSIGEDAFQFRTDLTCIAIPASVTTIGSSAFADCSSLTAITVNTSNSAYISVAGILFNQSQTMLVQYPAAKVGTSYTIPDSVTNLVEWAFLGCTRAF